jgi:putative methyltransferase (TIGR04325 family)
MSKPIWEGVYKTFKDVPSLGAGFSGERWIQNSLEKINAVRKDAQRKGTVSSVTQYRASLLPLVAAIVLHDFENVRILDFGGGIGFAYYQVLHGLPSSKNFELHIIEIDELCEVGKQYFKDEQKIFFHSSLPREEGLTFDIVHMGSSLHYCEEWEEVLSRLCRYQPRYFLFTDLPAGDIPTFATVQSYYSSKIPVWFFNIDEVINVMKKKNYCIVFKSAFVATVLGQEREIPQGNFEAQYRIGHTCNLLFAKRDPYD